MLTTPKGKALVNLFLLIGRIRDLKDFDKTSEHKVVMFSEFSDTFSYKAFLRALHMLQSVKAISGLKELYLTKNKNGELRYRSFAFKALPRLDKVYDYCGHKCVFELHTFELSNSEIVEKKQSVIYRATYQGGEIRVNDQLIAKTQLNGIPDLIFGHLMDYPNRTITIEELRAELKLPKKIPKLRYIIKNLGFTGDLKKTFFGSVSDLAIHFFNPVTAKRLRELDILVIDKIAPIVESLPTLPEE